MASEVPMTACRLLVAALFVLPAARSALAEAPAAPTLAVRYVAGAGPTLDGRLDDAAWRGVPELELDGGLVKAPRLFVSALADDVRLVVGVRWADTPPPALESNVPAFSTLTATFAGEPPQVLVVTLDGAAAKPGAAAVGCTGDGGASVELARPLVAGDGRAWLGFGASLALTLALEARDGSSATARVLLRRGAAPRTWTFEDGVVDQAAAGFTAALGGKGVPPSWLVAAAGSSKVLVQRSQDQTDARFPLALADGVVARDLDLSVRFQCLDGWKDRAAGLVWRAKDAANHYILRANALERNVVLYKMQDGLRVDIPPVGRESDYGVKTEFDPAAWHVLRVVVVGPRFEAWLDGRYLFHVVDTTFADPGTVGLWTKSDSVTAFDDLTLVQLDAPAGAR
jgi:hypothetical protein